ncbi:Uncharacterised protein [Mycobacteroides abscessus subsp. massiliense]|nr:Uncharacterised protein [Mycobacteroides abscessus subsp. massiliense]
MQNRVEPIQRFLRHPEVLEAHHQGKVLLGDEIRRRRAAPGIGFGHDVARRNHLRVGEGHRGVAGRQAGDGIGEREQVVRPVRPVGDAVVGRDELVGVVLAVHPSRHRIVHEGHHGPGSEVLGQEALAEGTLRDRVTERREGQRIRLGCGRVRGQGILDRVEDQRALGQPHRRPRAAAAYGVLEIGFSDIDRLADAGTVKTQAGQDLLSDRTDAGEEAFQGVALDLTGRIPDVFPLHVREPVLAGHPDVLVIGDTEHVGAAERVRGAIRR